MTQEELDSLCAEWQKRLRLQDWDVQAKVVHQSDIPEKQGNIHIFQPERLALIQIASPADNPSSKVCRAFPSDPEHTLIHELLEIHFDPFKKDRDPANLSQEQAINVIAAALVNLKRGNGHAVEDEMLGYVRQSDVEAIR